MSITMRGERVNHLGNVNKVRTWLKDQGSTLTDTDIVEAQQRAYRKIQSQTRNTYIKDTKLTPVTTKDGDAEVYYSHPPVYYVKHILLHEQYTDNKNLVDLESTSVELDQYRAVLKNSLIKDYKHSVGVETPGDFVRTTVYYLSELHVDLQNYYAIKQLIIRNDLDLGGELQNESLQNIDEEITSLKRRLLKLTGKTTGGVHEGRRGIPTF